MLAKSTVTVAALAAISLFSLSGCGTSPAATTTVSDSTSLVGSVDPSVDYKLVVPGTLTTCADVPYTPFEVEDPSAPEGYSGFDVDIVRAIAGKLGLKFNLVDVDFTALQSGTVLAANQCDLGVSAITITEVRKANVDFSDPYYDSLQSLLVPADSDYKTLADLAGKRIGVQAGTTGLSYAQQNAPAGTQIVEFPSDGELWPAIKAGQVDAVLQDQPVNFQHSKDDPNFKLLEEYPTDEQYGLVFAKDQRPTLVADVNTALAEMRTDGTYEKIYTQYFGN